MTDSPCTGICRLDPQEICVGCGRHIDEIIDWPSADDTRKTDIVKAARQRLSIIAAHSGNMLDDDSSKTQ